MEADGATITLLHEPEVAPNLMTSENSLLFPKDDVVQELIACHLSMTYFDAILSYCFIK